MLRVALESGPRTKPLSAGEYSIGEDGLAWRLSWDEGPTSVVNIRSVDLKLQCFCLLSSPDLYVHDGG